MSVKKRVLILALHVHMKKISAFILAVLYAAYAVTSLGSLDYFESGDTYSIEKTEHVEKEAKKFADFSKLQKIVKHVSTAVKAKTSRSNAALVDSENASSFYYFHEDDKIVAVLHPHLEHTPLFLKNCVLRI